MSIGPQQIRPFMIGGIALALILISLLAVRSTRAQSDGDWPIYLPLAFQRSPYPGRLYLPTVANRFDPWIAPFGTEISDRNLVNRAFRARAEELQSGWVRLNTVSWRAVQPTQGGAYNWSALTRFEADLRGAIQVGLTPIIVVDDSPAWATINDPFPTSCGAIRAEHFADFAAFMQALVERYKQPPFNVRHWELGNEPDVAPELVTPNMVYGCWGDKDDPYYGGRHYGEMLKTVTPAIRQADPQAQVIVGGLLLASPTSIPSDGTPQRFLEGILESGAASYFDIVAYHAYATSALGWDTDLYNNAWSDWGGVTVGKARFLREVMSRYGVDKPLFLDETGYRCPEAYARCANPGPEFLEPQADHLVRIFTRAWADGVSQVTWHTLNYSGWSEVGLLNTDLSPRPAFGAFQTFIKQVEGAVSPPVVVDYGNGIEAYRINTPRGTVDVLWSLDYEPNQIQLPSNTLIAVYARNGELLTTGSAEGDVQMEIGFAPVYLHLAPLGE